MISYNIETETVKNQLKLTDFSGYVIWAIATSLNNLHNEIFATQH